MSTNNNFKVKKTPAEFRTDQAGQLGTKDIINTSVLQKGRAKKVCLPDEMDHLSHGAVFIAVKAKRNTGKM